MIYSKIIKNNIKDVVRIDNEKTRDSYICLDKNERRYSLDDFYINKYKNAITSSHFSNYSNLESSYEKLSYILNVSRDELLLSYGADMAIRYAYEACINENDIIVIPKYHYKMHDIYSQIFNAKLCLVDLNERWEFKIDEVLSSISSKIKMVVIENGTLGNTCTVEQIKCWAKFLQKKDILLMVDEVYLLPDTNNGSTISLIKDFNNLIVVRSFSKYPGLAGARIGYLAGNKYLIKHLAKVKPVLEINHLAALAMDLALENPEMIHSYFEEINIIKKYIKRWCSNSNVKYRDTQGNFVLIYIEENVRTENIVEVMRDNNILIKKPFEDDIVRRWLRVSIGTKDEMEKFIKILSSILF